MKYFKTILISSMCLASLSQADSTCHQDMQRFFNQHAPTTQTVKVEGFYSKKSKMTGEFKPCELSVELKPDGLSPIWNIKTFDPSNGDGGAFWPFADFPTTEPVSDEYRDIYSFSCEANESEISTSFVFRSIGGWRKKYSTALSITKNSDGTYDLSVADNGFSSKTVCRGNLSGQ